MSYVPHTDEQRRAMLQTLGLAELEDLFADLPEAVRLRRPLKVGPGLSEPELRRHFQALAAANQPAAGRSCFLGAGLYDHYVPAVVDSVIARNEFYTAYTPYQPEISQGTLQVIFEFQTMICQLTGMEVANASMYDGASALAEAVLMATNITGREEIILPASIHPASREVCRTYTAGADLTLTSIDADGGLGTPVQAIRETLSDRTACVAIQQPNFFGAVADLADIAAAAHDVGALLVVSANPIALGLLAPPGQQGADIVVGEGQPLGLGLNFGGPLVGFFATRQQHVRRMPGRLVGQTTDTEGRTGYVLTLQTREQHIRRERATSNICTNQGLCLLAATAYLETMGKSGLRSVAEQCLRKAHYAAARIDALPGFAVVTPPPFFHEFAVRCPRSAAAIAGRLAEQGILAGYPLGRDYAGMDDCLLVAVTEQRTREEIDALVEALASL